MASITRNGKLYWLKGRNPLTGACVRVSLETADKARAVLLLRKWEAWSALFLPEFGGSDLPPRMRELLTGVPPGFACLLHPVQYLPAPGHVAAIPTSPVAVQPPPPPEPPLRWLLREYLEYCKSENSKHHAANKASKVKAAFGPTAVKGDGPLDGPLACARLSEVTASKVQHFIEERRKKDGNPLGKKTRRHYREVFSDLYEFAMRRDHYHPTNVRYPNPMTAGLPSYEDRNRLIEFLEEEQITTQLDALRPYPALRAAAATMIYAGPRRGECLWLQVKSIQARSYLSIRNLLDEAGDLTSSLKTGSRTVAIEPELMAIFDAYLPTLKGPWLFPSPTGRRRDKDHFSTALREANVAAGLPWSSMHFRHTFATRNARAGVSVFSLARAMGTSVAMIERYYAGFFPPSARGASLVTGPGGAAA
jgi:integrase